MVEFPQGKKWSYFEFFDDEDSRKEENISGEKNTELSVE